MLGSRSPVIAIVAVMLVLSPQSLWATMTELLVGYRHQGVIARFDSQTGSYIGTFASVPWPTNFTIHTDGFMYVVSTPDERIVKLNAATGALIGSFPVPGTWPLGIDIDSAGRFYISSYALRQVSRYDGMGNPLPGSGFPLTGIDQPYDVEIGPDGLLYAVGSSGIYRHDLTTGLPVGGTPFISRGGGAVTFAANGNLIVSDWDEDIIEYDHNTGALVRRFYDAAPGAFDPQDLVFGPNGNLFVVDLLSASVVQFDGTTGARIGTFASQAGLTGPWELAFVPEPASLVSAASIVAALGVTRRGRRTISRSKDVPERTPIP